MKSNIVYFIALVLVMSGCKEKAPLFTTYSGVVVEKNSMNPIEGLTVKITDGNNVYSESSTNGMGQFSIDFAHNTNLGMLYIDILGGKSYPSQRLDLIFTPEGKYDYGMIYLYDQTDDSLFPVVENVSWEFPKDNKSVRFKNISINSSFTLEETYVEIAQTQNLSGSKKYQLEKQTDGKYSCVVNNLIIGEKYYFQVAATNTIGTGKSKLYCRTFGAAMPEIIKLKEATVNSAIISISVTEEPLETLSSGICWSTSSNPTINDYAAYSSLNTTADVMMTNLDFSKESYYVRAFAKNANGISYSEILELPVNNPYNLPTFKSGGNTYSYKYMGKANWFTAYSTCKNLVFVFDDWTLPNRRILPDFFNTYYAENGETLPLPLWSMRPYEDWEIGENETVLLTANGEVMWSKNESYHYYAVRKF